MERITLDDLKTMDREMLTPEIVGRFLGVAPYSITVQARTRPDLLGFPVHVHGTRTLVPRRGLIKWAEGGCKG